MSIGSFATRFAFGFASYLAVATCYGQPHAAPTARVDAAISRLESFIGSGAKGDAWREYLGLTELKREIRLPSERHAAAVEHTLARLSSGAPGLDMPQFKALHDALTDWWATTTYGPGTDLAKAAAAGRTSFTAPDKHAADWAKSDLKAALQRLESYLAGIGRKGAGWRTYLMLGELDKQLASDKPDVPTLEKISDRFSANHPGLEMPVFADVGAKLTRYVDALELSGMPDLEQQYANELENLSKHLAARDPSEETTAEIGRSLGWLERTRQAGSLVRAVRRQHAHPNLYVRAAEAIVGGGIQQPINNVTPIDDVILGTDIHGTGRTVGRLDVELVPHRNRAVIDTMLRGTTWSNTVGYNGPATIYSEGATAIGGRKRIMLDADGFKSYPAAAAAVTRTRITGVSAGRGGLIERIARKRVYESKSQAERIGARHAEARVEDRLEREVQTGLSKAHDDFMRKFRNPLVRRGEFPQTMHFSTTADDLRLTVLQANPYQIAAPGDPPAIERKHELAVQVHQSMINNLANALLSGVTLHEDEVQKKVIEWRGSLPDELKSEEDRDPWSITFAERRPVSVTIDNDGFVVTIRGERYTSGDKPFRSMNITARYKVERSGGGSRMVRQGDLEVLPPGFVTGRDKLSGQQVSLRRLLQRRFGKLLKPEIVSEGLELPGKWKKLGRLKLAELVANGGWAMMAWDRPGHGDDQGKRLAQVTIGAKGLPR